MSVKSVSIRMEKDMLDKLRFIAKYEGHSLNGHVLFLIRKNIEEFEKEHGQIYGDISPDKVITASRNTGE